MEEKIIIGLEIHLQLKTKSKLFCGCSTNYKNSNDSVCNICLGMPGSKPVLNKNVLDKAISLHKLFCHQFLYYFYQSIVLGLLIRT